MARALDEAGASPRIRAEAHPAARIAALWRGRVPILTPGPTIWWPGARACFAGEPAAMATLQHELQHVLEFATGELTALSYLCSPRDWTYRWPQAPSWTELGAEQRAVAAQRLWLAERGLAFVDERPALAALIPWTA